MFLSLILIFLIASGGFVLTYLFAEDETFLWRFSAGNIVGSAILGTIGFIIACFFGLSALTAALAFSIILTPLFLLIKKELRGRIQADWERAKANLQGANLAKFLSFAWYVFFLVLFIFFFYRAMFETGKWIVTGGSQNLGDLPFHLGAIFSFTDGNNFPPQNPSYAGATFSYPFISDFLTAVLMKFGIGAEGAMFAQNVSWAFSLLVILENFTVKITGSRLAGKIAPALLFFSGGLGFRWFYNDFAAQNKSLHGFLSNLADNYTIRDNLFSWGNSLVVLFMTQRSILLGMPLTIIVLGGLWRIFTTKEPTKTGEVKSDKKLFSIFHFPFSIFFVGLVAGTLPLVHLHSLIVLFFVSAFLFVLKPEKWREWIVFGIGVCFVAVPELAWSIAGSATDTKEFFGWHWGWNKAADENFIRFWLKNTGIFIPLLGAGIFLLWTRLRVRSPKNEIQNLRNAERKINFENSILFYLPFLFCFIIANVYKFAPWEWDNIKILIYWFIGSLPFAAYALAWTWEKNIWLKIVAAACFFVLTASGAIDIWRTVSDQINYNVFDADAVRIAGQIRQKTAPNALILNAPTYNTPVVLSGRRSLMRYPGHLASYGIDYEPRSEDVKKMYQGDAASDILLRKYNIEYVLISPTERGELTANEAYFSKFPVVAESGEYKLYQVK